MSANDPINILMQGALDAASKAQGSPVAAMSPAERLAYAKGIHDAAGFLTACGTQVGNLMAERNPGNSLAQMFADTYASLMRDVAKELSGLIPDGFE
jgi:hypothetical protein